MINLTDMATQVRRDIVRRESMGYKGHLAVRLVVREYLTAFIFQGHGASTDFKMDGTGRISSF